MQKWCPEPLAVPTGANGAFVSLGGRSLATGSAPPPATEGGGAFRPEAGFADHRSVLEQLSREERAQLVDLVDLDLRSEYDRRLGETEAACAGQIAEAQIVAEQRIATWTAEFADQMQSGLEEALRATADAAVHLALAMAEKIVRARVEVDDEVLLRGIETVLFKAEPGATVSVTCHPDDAANLRSAPEVCARLRISDVKEDRRIQLGGCLVRAADLEWDATVRRQLTVLEEVAREALATNARDVAKEVPDAPAPLA